VEVRPGYKQTEVGVIPEDWEVPPLGHVIEYIKGFAFSAGDYQSHGIRILRVSDTTYDEIKEGESIFIDETKAKSFRKWSLKEGDLIVSTVGSKPPMYDSMVGKATFVQAKDSGALLNQNAVILRSKKWSIGLQRLLHNHLRQDRYLTHIEKIFRGNANQASITLKELFEYPIPLPPTKAEQEAIAEVLSDADALIESFEQLIAKKRHLKQGAMQELLRPKHRWERKCIGDLLTIAHGKNQYAVVDRNGIYPILATGGQIGTANRFLYNKPSVLIGRKGTIDRPQYMEQPFWTVDTLFYSVIHEPNNAKYLFYQFCLIDWKQYNEASGVPSLNARTIERIELRIPPPDEQTAIASILSDMDVEITALEAKLGKASQLKQGMMHNLLTGRVRLI
jgi:type I restriction enzyme S subunit